MMNEHTPGPLEIDRWDGQDRWPILGQNPNENSKEPVPYTGHGIRVADAYEEYYANLFALAPALLEALIGLQRELHAHIRLDVKRHYSLMVADAIASTAISKAKGVATVGYTDEF